MSQKLKIGLVPLTSTDRVDVNVSRIFESLHFFESNPVDLVCLPENALYFNFKSKIDPQDVITLDNPEWNRLSAWSRQWNTSIHVGGTPLKIEDHIFNASVVIFPGLKPQVVYKKIHLFDVNVEGRRVCESDSFSPGEELAIIDINGWKLGLSICYDLRFAEMFVKYHRQNVDGVLVPASFLVPTGRAHWLTLLKARAIETQSFVIAAAQVGTHHSQLFPELPTKQTWGQSVVLNPWGQALAMTEDFDQWPEGSLANALLQPLVVELDRTLIETTRQQIPLLSHRKLRI